MHGARNEDMKNENSKNNYTFWWGIGGPNGWLENHQHTYSWSLIL